MRLLSRLYCLLLVLGLASCSRSPFKGWNPPIAAGDSVVRCYSRLDATEAEIDRALRQVWQHYPENRYDSTTIRLVRSALLQRTPVESQQQLGPLPTEAEALKRSGSPFNYPFWTLKSANSNVLYTLNIANCSEDAVQCDLCIKDITLLPPTTPLRKGNWNLTTQERANAEIWFEQDILVKLKTFIAQERRQTSNRK